MVKGVSRDGGGGFSPIGPTPKFPGASRVKAIGRSSASILKAGADATARYVQKNRIRGLPKAHERSKSPAQVKQTAGKCTLVAGTMGRLFTKSKSSALSRGVSVKGTFSGASLAREATRVANSILEEGTTAAVKYVRRNRVRGLPKSREKSRTASQVKRTAGKCSTAADRVIY